MCFLQFVDLLKLKMSKFVGKYPMNKINNNMETIGLFPLGIVLFPESVYPLHIFEDRYKKLVNEALADNRYFGINYINDSSMQEIGCSAKIADLMKSYPDGKMDILVTGIRRYKVINFKQDDKPYYTADVEYFDDENSNVSTLLLEDSIELFNQIAENVKSIKVDKITRIELDTEMPSFYMATKAGLTQAQKQYLLELRSENERLTFIIEHMRRILPIIKNKDDLGEILKYDGYYKPDFFKS